MNINLKARLKNKTFWVAFLALVAGGYRLITGTELPAGINEVANVIIGGAIALGIIVDTSTPGISDK
jgi:uncharacterized membrane protein